MNATDFAAWLGALTGSLALLWDIFKWLNSGPQLTVSASAGMKIFGNFVPEILRGKKFIVVSVNNIGSNKTTITHLLGEYYSILFNKLIIKPISVFIVVDPAISRIPHVLEPGEQWQGLIEQNENVENMIRTGYFYCGIHYLFSRKPALKRIVKQNIIETQPEAPHA